LETPLTSDRTKGEAAVGTLAFDKFGQPIGALVDDCKATPRASLGLHSRLTDEESV
jgi:hypothetical protein